MIFELKQSEKVVENLRLSQAFYSRQDLGVHIWGWARMT